MNYHIKTNNRVQPIAYVIIFIHLNSEIHPKSLFSNGIHKYIKQTDCSPVFKLLRLAATLVGSLNSSPSMSQNSNQ